MKWLKKKNIINHLTSFIDFLRIFNLDHGISHSRHHYNAMFVYTVAF